MTWVSFRHSMGTAFVLVIITVLVTYRLSSAVKANATMIAVKEVAPCISGHCVKTDAYNPEREMKRRGQNLKATCEKLHKEVGWNTTTSVKSLTKGDILVDDFHQIAVCIIPKIASSNVRRIFLHIGNYVNKTSATDITDIEVNKYHNNIKLLSDGPEYAVRRRLRLYKKVIVVRDPFERLLSAFRSKFEHKNHYLQNMAPKIIRAVRKNGTTSDAYDYTITFAEFIQYLLLQHSQNQKFDEHWATYTDLCKPCYIQYSYVGNYNTFDEDIQLVMKEIGANNSIGFPKRGDRYKDVRTSALMEQYYKIIPSDQIQKLIKIYSHDQLLFDLQIPDTLTKLLNPL